MCQVGYWKDLLEILVRACVGADKLEERRELQVQTRNYMKWVCRCTNRTIWEAWPGLTQNQDRNHSWAGLLAQKLLSYRLVWRTSAATHSVQFLIFL